MSTDSISFLKSGMFYQMTKKEAMFLADRVVDEYDHDRSGRISLRESKLLLKDANRLLVETKPRELTEADFDRYYAYLHRDSPMREEVSREDLLKLAEEFFVNDSNTGSRTLTAQHAEYFDAVKTDMKTKNSTEIKSFLYELACKRLGKGVTDRSLAAARKMFDNFDENQNKTLDKEEFFELFGWMIEKAGVKKKKEDYLEEGYDKVFEVLESRKDSNKIEVEELECWILRGMLSS